MKRITTNPPAMARSLRALAWLLRYPDAELRAVAEPLRTTLCDEGALGAARLAELGVLIDGLPAAGMRAESEYIELFDRGRRTSLHLFEHVHGDSRDRGPAMVDLAQTYERAGLRLLPGELPDYLPVVLEFASTQPPPQAREFLRETAHIVQAIHTALVERRSPYAGVLAAVLDLAGERPQAVPLPAEPTLDESWAEPEAFGGCTARGQSRPDEARPVHIVRTDRATRRAAA